MTIDAAASSSSSSSSSTSKAANNTPGSSGGSHGVGQQNSMPSTPVNQSSNQSGNFSPSPINIMKKNRSDVIKTIQEIAKIDEYTINQAIEACQDSEGRYSMDQVLNILMDEHQQDSSTSKSRSGHGTTSGNSDEKYSLPKSRGSVSNDRANEYSANAYGASNNLDEEDEDDYENLASQSVNASPLTLSSSSSLSKNFSESNLLREEGKPSGLKNVGNTCWFNSIIQAFFHLPYFRRLILSFQIDQNDVNKLDENAKNVVQFVIELRKLFTLMLKSKRKSINPNPTLRCLSNCSKYDAEKFNQEDVSEFATILVNLIEESFDILFKLQQNQQTCLETSNEQVKLLQQSVESKNEASSLLSMSSYSSTTSILNTKSLLSSIQTDNSNQALINVTNQINMRKNRKNPIVNLLNGDILINRKNSEENVTNSLIEIFREVNIQMLNARNLHAGLELEWGETSIDKLITPISASVSKNNTTETSAKEQTKMNKSFYQQESWIVQLPPVLFICLNRYKFVKATQSSSKIIEPFEFYPFIYLDRYMYGNRELVKSKRKELQNFNQELKRLEDKLKSIKNYKLEGSASHSEFKSGNEYALDDVLKCVLQFATNDYSLNEVFSSIKPITKNESREGAVKENETLEVVQECLRNWIVQISEKISDLETRIKEITNKIDKIFDEEDLKKVRYNLHSVCIHEGNAASGHFWTYIWNTKQLKWYKFNDVEVCESNWDDLYANAVGGYNTTITKTTANNNNTKIDYIDDVNNQTQSNEQTKTNTIDDLKTTTKTVTNSDRTPSAYFLVYVKAEDTNLYEENDTLDQDLIKLINNDQENLENQIFNFKLKQLLRDSLERLKKSNTSLSEAIQNSSLTINNEQNNQTCIEHAKSFSDSTSEAFSCSFDRILTKRNYFNNAACSKPQSLLAIVEEALNYAIDYEIKKYDETSKDIVNKLPENDLRIQHILTYLSCNNVNRDIRVLAMYDLFRMQIYAENTIKLKLMQTLAQLKYNEYLFALTSSVGDGNGNPEIFKVYEKWQTDYRDFRSIIAAFLNAGNFMESQRYEESATFFCVACEYNERLTSNLTLKMKGMDHEFLLSNRRRCLKLWNQSVIRKFAPNSTAALAISQSGNFNEVEQLVQPLNQQELVVLIETMISKFLPCFFRLANSTNEDKAMLEEIRQDWLGVLDSNLPELQVFHDFMAKLFDDPFANHSHSLNVNKTNLLTRYKDIVQTLKKNRKN